jgi:hypothetical protein
MDQREPPRKPPPPAGGRPRDPLELEDERDLNLGPDRDLHVEGTPPSRRFRRLVSAQAVRRIPPDRLAVVILGLLGAIVLAVVLGAISWNRGVAYVNGQPQFQLTHTQIELDPSVPPWFKGHREAFLERVWAGTAEPRTLSALDFDGERLLKLFRRNPWVKRAIKVVHGYPNKVVVLLEFRSPVALARLPDGSKIPLDREGVILPLEDIDLEAAGPLVWLDDFKAPSGLSPGEVWGVLDPQSGVDRPDDRLIAAAQLADFLKSRLGDLSGVLSPPLFVHVLPWDDEGSYVQLSCVDSLGDKLMVCWNDPSASREVRKLGPERKWILLCDWIRRNLPGRSDRRVYLQFMKDRVATDPRRGVAPATSLKDRERGVRSMLR